jgi:hypothetical protein
MKINKNNINIILNSYYCHSLIKSHIYLIIGVQDDIINIETNLH